MEVVLKPGDPWPLGAHWNGHGVNFALFSENARKVELCIFQGERMQTFPLPERTNNIWHGYLEGAKPGLTYAYKVHGENRPGNKFNPNILLLDPYAKELTGSFTYQPSSTSAHGLKCKVLANTYDWEGDTLPNIPWTDSVLYEAHIKGTTRLHPDIPEHLRGTYQGLSSPVMIDHFKKLGITAVSLLPVHYFIDEARLLKNGLTNYWGYNTLSFFVPDQRYASGNDGQSAIAEFRTMVKALHAAGIEVILDVVFNHTAETDEFGPTVSLRGIDNASYYLLPADNPDLYINYSGCGNTLNLANPDVLRLVMDALRYWVNEMHVDGFRFDLAAIMTRNSAFLGAIHQDPVLSQVKLIAEPWDLGPEGYQLGQFTPGWGEWNDRFRDDIRAYWLTGGAGSGALAQRLSASSETFRHRGRSPRASINFITAHDGFSLRDLVSYQHKHNERNGEGNRDGHGHNLSWNCGVEGETQDASIIECRQKLQRALLTTLLISQGVPMLQAGDELGRTQSGNNNAYCQDNPTTWIDWANIDKSLFEFVCQLIGLRRRFPQLHNRSWLSGQIRENGSRDVTWWHPNGRQMQNDDWHANDNVLGFILAPDARGNETLLALFNRGVLPCVFRLPEGNWESLCITDARVPFTHSIFNGTSHVAPRSVQLFVKKR